MQAGNVGGGDREGGRKSSTKDKIQVSVCDLSSDDFKKTWLTLKELHDKELQRIQAKLTTLRKERLADGRWSGSTAKIKELTEQQKVLNNTIHDLRQQLNAKVCDRCSMNETYRNTLQQEFYDIQQQNLKFIAELTAERNKLREENKQLSARLKVNQQQFRRSFSDSDDDFIPCTQRSVFSVREPPPGSQVPLPIQLLKQANTEQVKSAGKKEQPQSPKFPIPFYSQDLFEVPETPLEKTSSTRSNVNQKSPTAFPLTSTLGPQTGCGFQGDSTLPEDRLGRPQRKSILAQKTSTQKASAQKASAQKCETQMDFSWSLSSISTAETPPTQIVSETSEENMPDYKKSSLPSLTQRKDKLPSNVFPFEGTLRSTGKRRSTIGIGFSVRDGCSQMPSNEQSTLRKNTNEAAGAGYGADKPQGETQSFILGSAIKRKAKMQSEKRAK